MCFSAEASFAVGGALLPTGIYCIRMALRKDRKYLALAMIPLFLSAQQMSEGAVWLGVHHQDVHLTEVAALGFLFFALSFWPFWVPFSVFWIEPRPWRRLLIGLGTLLSLAWFVILYYPLLSDPHRWLTTQIVHHSIQYSYPDLPVYGVVPRAWLRLLYLATMAVPVACSSERGGLPYGGLLLLSALVSHIAFSYAFVSVWCFFAAVLALSLCILFHRMPVKPFTSGQKV